MATRGFIPTHPAPAFAFMVAALGIATFSGMDAAMKGLSISLGVLNALLWRSIFSTAMAGAIFFARRSPWPAWPVIRLHILRALVAGGSVALFFWGLVRMPLAPGVALSFIAPLITLFLAALLLGETVGRGAIMGSAVAFAGVLVIVAGQLDAAPGPEALLGALAILAAAILYAYNLVLMRRQSQVAGPVEVVFFLNLTLAVVFGAASPLFGGLPGAAHLPMLLFASMLSLFSLLLLSWAYAHAEASYLAPVEYTAFIWASILGWLVFGESLTLATIAGAALIVVGCLVAARRRPPPAPGVEAAP